MNTHSVDGAEWDADRGINNVPDARWVAGPVYDGRGIGARQGPGGTSRSFWPEEELCGLFITEASTAESEINIVPDARWVAGPVNDGHGIGATQGPGGTSRSFWPEEELCGLFITEASTAEREFNTFPDAKEVACPVDDG